MQALLRIPRPHSGRASSARISSSRLPAVRPPRVRRVEDPRVSGNGEELVNARPGDRHRRPASRLRHAVAAACHGESSRCACRRMLVSTAIILRARRRRDRAGRPNRPTTGRAAALGHRTYVSRCAAPVCVAPAQGFAQGLFDDRLEGGVAPRRQALGPAQQRVSNIYGCLHMVEPYQWPARTARQNRNPCRIHGPLVVRPDARALPMSSRIVNGGQRGVSRECLVPQAGSALCRGDARGRPQQRDDRHPDRAEPVGRKCEPGPEHK